MICFGVDVGKLHDRTAIAAAEPEPMEITVDTGEGERLVRTTKWCVRGVRRLSLGVAYPDMADQLCDVILTTKRKVQERTDYLLSTKYAGAMPKVRKRIKAKSIEIPTVYIDATGVGQPVADLLQDRLRTPTGERQAKIVCCYFQHGVRRDVKGPRRIHLGKEFIVSRLQALLQTGRLEIPRTTESEILRKELLNYQTKVSRNKGSATFGAHRSGTHDDLVTALALAVQAEPQPLKIIKFPR